MYHPKKNWIKLFEDISTSRPNIESDKQLFIWKLIILFFDKFIEYTVINNPIKVTKTIKPDTNKSNLNFQSKNKFSNLIKV